MVDIDGRDEQSWDGANTILSVTEALEFDLTSIEEREATTSARNDSTAVRASHIPMVARPVYPLQRGRCRCSCRCQEVGGGDRSPWWEQCAREGLQEALRDARTKTSVRKRARLCRKGEEMGPARAGRTRFCAGWNSWSRPRLRFLIWSGDAVAATIRFSCGRTRRIAGQRSPSGCHRTILYSGRATDLHQQRTFHLCPPTLRTWRVGSAKKLKVPECDGVWTPIRGMVGQGATQLGWVVTATCRGCSTQASSTQANPDFFEVRPMADFGQFVWHTLNI